MTARGPAVRLGPARASDKRQTVTDNAVPLNVLHCRRSSWY